jgi:hypothetical protein
MLSRRIVILMLSVPMIAGAQGGDRSVSREILDRARAALSSLEYARADEAARSVLSMGLLSREARIEALQLIAAANFPDPPAERREPAARSALAQLIQIDLGLTIARDLSTAGLDSLYQSVLLSTFGTSVFVRRENPLNGVDGTAPIRVRASRPSAISVSLRTKDGIEQFLLDSVPNAVDTTLALRVSRNGRPFIRGGQYDLVVTAIDLTSRQAVVKEFDAVALVPAIDYVQVPTAIDSTLLKPERSRPERAGGFVAAGLVGIGTFVLGRSLRAPDPIRASGETDRRYATIGAVLALGTAAAAWFDRGRVLDKGISSNRVALSDLSNRQRAATEENVRRSADYRASITVSPESR